MRAPGSVATWSAATPVRAAGVLTDAGGTSNLLTAAGSSFAR
jgi:hypothetical protein